MTGKPRGHKLQPYHLNFVSDPVSVSFDVTAYPAPHSLTFTYMGPSDTDTGAAEVKEDEIRLKGTCDTKPGVVYLSTCTVTVENMTTAAAAGFYSVTVSNTLGSGRFRLKVTYKGEKTVHNNIIEVEDTGVRNGFGKKETLGGGRGELICELYSHVYR